MCRDGLFKDLKSAVLVTCISNGVVGVDSAIYGTVSFRVCSGLPIVPIVPTAPFFLTAPHTLTLCQLCQRHRFFREKKKLPSCQIDPAPMGKMTPRWHVDMWGFSLTS